MPNLRMSEEKWPKTAANAFRLPKLPSLTGNRGRWIQWCCHCSWKLRNSCFCACTVKMWLKIILNVVKSQNFPSLYRKSMSLRTTVITDFRMEAQIMPNLCSVPVLRKMAKNGRKRFPIAKIAPCYRKSGSLNPMPLSKTAWKRAQEYRPK